MAEGVKTFVLRWMVITLCLLGLGGCTQPATKDRAEEKQTEETETNMENQEEDSLQTNLVFEGHDLEGNVVSSEIFSGSKLTMVNVWATYCNPCLREMPGLGELANAYAAEEFQMIGIISDVQEGADEDMLNLAADLVAQTGADYTHLLLNESLYRALLTGVSAVPTTFFIDHEGNILDTVVGSMEKEAWEETIHALLETL